MRWSPIQRGLTLAVSLLWCAGCVTDLRYNYHEVVPDFNATGSGQLAVATYDQRPYILSGQYGPQFVGLATSGYVTSTAVRTQSARPLAEDISRVVCNALQHKGFRCAPVLVSPTERLEDVQQKVRWAADTLALLLTLHEWKSETTVSTVLMYHVTLQVLDTNGVVVANASTTGQETLGTHLFDPVRVAQAAIPQAFQQKLEALLNHPLVVATLQKTARN